MTTISFFLPDYEFDCFGGSSKLTKGMEGIALNYFRGEYLILGDYFMNFEKILDILKDQIQTLPPQMFL